jgi:hypothetical protein
MKPEGYPKVLAVEEAIFSYTALCFLIQAFVFLFGFLVNK